VVLGAIRAGLDLETDAEQGTSPFSWPFIYDKRPISQFGLLSLLASFPHLGHKLALPIRPKYGNVIRENIHVILIGSQTRPIPINHTRRADSIQIIHINLALALARLRIAGAHAGVDAEDLRLAGFVAAGGAARRVVVVEEAVEPGAVDEEVVGVEDAEAPGVAAVSGARGAVDGEIGVVVSCYWREGAEGSRGIGLIVTRIVRNEDIWLGLCSGKLTEFLFGFGP
jgi:hypothetical protein